HDQCSVILNKKMKTFENVLYRIDKTDYIGSMNFIRSNLFKLFDKKNEKLRKLIVELDEPKFDEILPIMVNENHLNEDQKKAIGGVLKCKDYCLILGMPGTGKSTTIALIVKYLLKL